MPALKKRRKIWNKKIQLIPIKTMASEYDYDAESGKSKFIEHCNSNVFTRLYHSKLGGVGLVAIRDIEQNVDIIKTIDDVHPEESIILTRSEIMTEIEHCNVRKLIFDMFPPKKHIKDKNLDTFALPAKGLNDLPFHYFMNADHPCNSNVVAIPGVCDEFYYMSPVSSRKIKEGDELLWSSDIPKIVKSAGEYDFHTFSRRLCEEGGDVGREGKALFDSDGLWHDVLIYSFEKGGGDNKRGVYRFVFPKLNEDGEQIRGPVSLDELEDVTGEDFGEDIDHDDVSVFDETVRVLENTNAFDIHEDMTATTSIDEGMNTTTSETYTTTDFLFMNPGEKISSCNDDDKSLSVLVMNGGLSVHFYTDNQWFHSNKNENDHFILHPGNKFVLHNRGDDTTKLFISANKVKV